MKPIGISAHEKTLDAWWDLIPTDATYLIKYNTYRQCLSNEGYKIRTNWDGRHSLIAPKKPKKRRKEDEI